MDRFTIGTASYLGSVTWHDFRSHDMLKSQLPFRLKSSPIKNASLRNIHTHRPKIVITRYIQSSHESLLLVLSKADAEEPKASFSHHKPPMTPGASFPISNMRLYSRPVRISLSKILTPQTSKNCNTPTVLSRSRFPQFDASSSSSSLSLSDAQVGSTGRALSLW